MSVEQTPCEANPDQWFIDKNGLLDEEEVLDEDQVKARLVARRHARDACFTQCQVRTLCLDVSMRNREPHGTWGGYHEEQRRKMLTLLDAKQSRESLLEE